MSYIGNCQLSGYKSIKNVSCEFNKGLNIIIGNNGSGKTNLLEFIYKILKRDYTGLDVFTADIKIINKSDVFDWIAKGEALNEKVNPLGRPQKIGISDPANEKSVFVEFVRFNLPNEIPILSTEYNPKYSFTDRRLLVNGSNKNMPFVMDFWLPLFFHSSEFHQLKSDDELNDDFVFRSLAGWFIDNFDDIKKELAIYTPIEDIRFSNAIRVTRIDSSTFEIRNIVFEYKVNNQWLSWEALSDGTKRLVYAIFMIQSFDVEMVGPSLKNKIEIIPIVFIEEPEIGIHPHQLHLLLTLLKEKAEKQQIIVTTHSPQVLDVLSAEELDHIFIAEIDYEKGTAIRKLTEKETEKAKLYLQDNGMLSDYWRFSDLQRSKQSK